MRENNSPLNGEILLYATASGKVKVEVEYRDESFWLSQKRMADQFGVDVRTISEHLQNIFRTAELAEEAVIRKSRTTAEDGKSYLTNFYNLDAIISVDDEDLPEVDLPFAYRCATLHT